MKNNEIRSNSASNGNSSLDYFFRHPLIISIITLTIGSGLFTYINDRRKSEDLRKQKAIEFLDKTSQEFDELMTYMGGSIGAENVSKSSIEKIHNHYADLLVFRTRIQISSSVYFKEENFYTRINYLISELGKIYNYLRLIYQNKYISAVHDKEIEEGRKAFLKGFVSVKKSKLKKPFADLDLWFWAIHNRYISEMKKATSSVVN